MNTGWIARWTNKRSRHELVGTACFLGAALGGLLWTLDFVEQRAGATLDDPLLAVVGPTDLTWLTFGLIYGGLVAAILLLLTDPDRLVMMIQTYSLMTVIRIACLLAFPLDPPPGMIPLQDPFVGLFGAAGTALTRDLFFSGHTATLFLLTLGMTTRFRKWIFGLATAGVACAVLLQHVHYTADVLVATLAAIASYATVITVRRRFRNAGP